MYCYTVANNLMCILRELDMWSEISMEHHTFLLKVAQLTNKRLTPKLVDRIENSRMRFKNLNQEVKNAMNLYQFPQNPFYYQSLAEQVRELLQTFLNYDNLFLDILYELKEIGKEDKVWQTLVEHITHEQTYMKRLFRNLLYQLR